MQGKLGGWVIFSLKPGAAPGSLHTLHLPGVAPKTLALLITSQIFYSSHTFQPHTCPPFPQDCPYNSYAPIAGSKACMACYFGKPVVVAGAGGLDPDNMPTEGTSTGGVSCPMIVCQQPESSCTCWPCACPPMHACCPASTPRRC